MATKKAKSTRAAKPKATGGDADGSSGNRVKDPKHWTTGDEPMTEAQRSYVHTLAEETGEPVDDTMTKAEASEKIDELRGKSDRVSESDGGDRPE